MRLPPAKRWTRLARGVLLAVLAAGVAGVLLGLLQVRAVPVGPFSIRTSNPFRPLAAVVMAAGVLLVCCRDVRALRLTALASLTLLVPLGVMLFTRLSPADWNVGDQAFTELYTVYAAAGQQALGPYSQYGWHHPGPLLFYVLAPFHVLGGGGPSSLQGGALVINMAAVAGTAAILMRPRVEAPLLAPVVVLALGAYALKVPPLLVNDWNPHVLVLPFAALVCLTTAIAAGDIRLLPAAAVAGSFVVQTHLGLLPVAGALALATLASVLAGLRRGRLNRDETLRSARYMAWTLAAVWTLPVAEQLIDTPGNLTRIARFMGESRDSTPAPGDAVNAFSSLFLGAFGAGFDLARGWAYNPPYNPWSIAGATAVAAGLPLAARRERARRNRFGATLAWQCAVASIAAAIATFNIRGPIADHQIFWCSVLGVLSAAVLVSACLPVTTAAAVARAGRITTILCCIGIGILGIRELRAGFEPYPREESRVVEDLTGRLLTSLPRLDSSRPLVQVDSEAWGIAAGLVLQLKKRGHPVAIEPALVNLFGRPLAPNGSEDLLITIAGRSAHERLSRRSGNIVIAERRGVFLDAVRIGPGTAAAE